MGVYVIGVLLLVVPFLVGFIHPTLSHDIKSESPINSLESSYVPHDPIEIGSDADFENQGWPGDLHFSTDCG